jgi:hypothetical protein
MLTTSAQVGLATTALESATTALESAATAIGAGMLVSGFVMAALGLARGRTRGQIEKNSLRDACFGGLFAILMIALDLSMRYFV